jgi:hypothetical protein
VIDAATIEDLKSQHGDIHLLTSRDHEVIVRVPKEVEYKRFRAQSNDPNKRDIATEALVKAVVVWPEADAFTAMLKAHPALCEEFAEPVLELVGLVGEAIAKKL